MRYLSIPNERVSALRGEDDATLAHIQDLVNADIRLDGNEVEIDGDPLEEIRAYNIVKAVGRGFDAEDALRLLEDNADICVIDVTRYANTDNAKRRLKGRVIGRDGETRRKIEEDTDTAIAVYGKTVSIVGKLQHVEVAREAVTMLLDGRSHATVYKHLKRSQAKLV